MATSDYVDLTTMIVKRIVDNPDAVEVVAHDRGRSTVIEVAVAEGDMGKVIGKGGRSIEAIRAVVRAAGLRQDERVQVELREDEEYQRPGEAGEGDVVTEAADA